jgi:hypothetical protein
LLPPRTRRLFPMIVFVSYVSPPLSLSDGFCRLFRDKLLIKKSLPFLSPDSMVPAYSLKWTANAEADVLDIITYITRGSEVNKRSDDDANSMENRVFRQ